MAFEPGAEVFDEIAPHPDGVDPADELIHERAYVVRAYRKGPTLGAARLGARPEATGPVHPGGPRAAHGAPHDRRPAHRRAVARDHRAKCGDGDASARRLPAHRRPLRQARRPVDRPWLHAQGARAVRRPRGCTHTTALLQAMAPVAIQSMWSFRVAEAERRRVRPARWAAPRRAKTRWR